MKKLLFAALGALLFASGFTVPSFAQNGFSGSFPPGTQIRRAVGDQITFTATNAAFNWGFPSDFVEFCIYPTPEAGGEEVYVRFGTSVNSNSSDASEATVGGVIVATSDAIFQDGATTAFMTGSAMVFHAPDDSLGDTSEVETCYGPYPWVTDGLVFHVVATAGASLNVRAYSTR